MTPRPRLLPASMVLAAHAVPAALAVTATLVLLSVGIATGQRNWPVYLAVMVLGGTGLLHLERRVALSSLTRWGLVIFGVGHAAGGMVPVGEGVLYQWWIVEDLLRYDNLQHAWGFGFVGRATWEALAPLLAPRRQDLVAAAAWVVVLGAVAFGAANEIFEYGLTLILAETHVGGYENTARDLIANLVGGLLVAAWTAHELQQTR